MGKQAPKRYSLEEILQLEVKTGEKWEFYGNYAVCMAGSSPNHSLIQANCIGEVNAALKRSKNPCQTYSSDLKLVIEEFSRYFYPDLSIFCEKLNKSQHIQYGVNNPTVIFEVVSKNSFRRDHSIKKGIYLQISSLKSYIVIDQYSCSVQIHNKKDENIWTFAQLLDMEDWLVIPALEIEIQLKEIYRGVEFDNDIDWEVQENELIYRTKIS
ncbi:MAG: Uma2 family endonuclease [Bacteroidia bacterium]|nr:Uma2 family endonuclease [Bacteroidia bacterium]